MVLLDGQGLGCQRAMCLRGLLTLICHWMTATRWIGAMVVTGRVQENDDSVRTRGMSVENPTRLFSFSMGT